MDTKVPPPTSGAAWPSPATGPSISGGHFLPEQATAVALLDRLLHHATVVVTAGESYRMREARTRGGGAALIPA